MKTLSSAEIFSVNGGVVEPILPTAVALSALFGSMTAGIIGEIISGRPGLLAGSSIGLFTGLVTGGILVASNQFSDLPVIVLATTVTGFACYTSMAHLESL